MKRHSQARSVPLATLAVLPALLGALLAGSCTIVSVDSASAPPRLESAGLVEGHAAVGLPAEGRLLHLDLFDGESDGAVAELVVWKLFRLELGLAGFSVGVGPLSVGLGVLAYEPEVPRYERLRREEAPAAPAEMPAPPPAGD